jgi:Uma2 family endonuclease
MSQATIAPPTIENLADLVKRLGDIPLERIRFRPAPGTATEKDLIEIERRGDSPLCELVDGTVVDRAIGFKESLVTSQIACHIGSYLDRDDRGFCVLANCLMRFAVGLVRCPSVAFFSWDKFPGRWIPDDPIADVVPDLVVEVLRKGNTWGEMARKVREFLDAGVRLVWLIDPPKCTARVFSTPDQSDLLREDQELDGGDVLPGFSVPLAELFHHMPPARKN